MFAIPPNYTEKREILTWKEAFLRTGHEIGTLYYSAFREGWFDCYAKFSSIMARNSGNPEYTQGYKDGQLMWFKYSLRYL